MHPKVRRRSGKDQDVNLNVEGRYSWVKGELDQDFIDFQPMDLGGFRFGAGINFVF